MDLFLHSPKHFMLHCDVGILYYGKEKMNSDPLFPLSHLSHIFLSVCLASCHLLFSLSFRARGLLLVLTEG